LQHMLGGLRGWRRDQRDAVLGQARVPHQLHHQVVGGSTATCALSAATRCPQA
ncbi:hypothetical protein BAE44_0007187, partial [Dichanthelium oligosanthes]